MKKEDFIKMKNEMYRYNIVYDILVKFAGAFEGDRMTFVINHLSENEYPCSEWRFQGHFGYGGKYYRNNNRISYYREDETEELNELLKIINEKLSMFD